MPAFQNKFPSLCSQEIIVQDDIAFPHKIVDEEEFLVTCNEARTVKILLQPANRPDFNVVDLGLFSLFSPYIIEQMILILTV